jgi:Fe-S-cluster containining protein
MDEPTHNLGFLTYDRDSGSEEVEFYYPVNVTYDCVRCGACCRDVDKRERMIRLLYKDIQRIEEVTDEEFYEEWDEGSFEGLMLKNHGKCVFLTGGGCRVYDERALLCRMYPFWLERQDDVFVFGVDPDCPGQGEGRLLDERFFRELLVMALDAMDY